MKFTITDKDGNTIGTYERTLVHDICDTVDKSVPYIEKTIDLATDSSVKAFKNLASDTGNIAAGLANKDMNRVGNTIKSSISRKANGFKTLAKIVYGASKTGICCIARKI